MGDRQAVLRVNGAFYTAFANADFAAMIEVWARDDNITCVHPGWDVLTCYHDVMKSWQTILEGGAAPRIRYRAARAVLLGNAAFVTCNEVVDGGLLVATNVFAHQDGGWRMIHHHAGPCAAREPAPEADLPGASLH